MTVPKGSTWGDGTNEPVGMPERVELLVTYTSDDPAKPVYEDGFLLDEAAIGLTRAPADGPDPRPKLTEGEKDLHKMLAAIARAIGEGNR